MAIAERWLAARFNRPGHRIVDHDIYAICGDGDLMEGITEEAASLAGHLKLGKLIYLYAAPPTPFGQFPQRALHQLPERGRVGELLRDQPTVLDPAAERLLPGPELMINQPGQRNTHISGVSVQDRTPASPIPPRWRDSNSSSVYDTSGLSRTGEPVPRVPSTPTYTWHPCTRCLHSSASG